MAKVVHSHEKKQDFIDIICSMSDTEINDYIKAHGKPPKLVLMYDIIDRNRDLMEFKSDECRDT